MSNKYAVVIGISYYIHINELHYCDEDAVSWCDYLTLKGYTIYLLGDGKNKYDPYVPINTATETNVRKCVQEIAAKITSNDQFVFIDSGHGSSLDKILGVSTLCMTDAYNLQGLYLDTEFTDDITPIITKAANIIIFIDACFSGGFIDNIINASSNVSTHIQKTCILVTCTQKGYGYENNNLKHGAWTYYLLIKTLMSNDPPTNLLDAFNKAIVEYPYSGDDMPQLVGNSELYF
jgi:hypothetical protein